MQPSAFPTLETQRLALRELTHEDAPVLLADHQNADHMRYWGAAAHGGPNDAHDFIAACRSNWKMPIPAVRWALVRRSDDAVLGTCGLFNWDQRWHKCTLGYEIGAAHVRQGFMREALQAVLDFGFKRGKLHRVEALIHPDNAASLALAAGLGFQVEGRAREIALWADAHHDMLSLALLRTEFEASNHPNH